MRQHLSEEYLAYLKSSHWAKLKERLFGMRPKRCEVCQTKEHIDVHHLLYRETMEATMLKDLMPLCRRCHDLIHDEFSHLVGMNGITDAWVLRRKTWAFLAGRLGLKDWEPTMDFICNLFRQSLIEAGAMRPKSKKKGRRPYHRTCGKVHKPQARVKRWCNYNPKTFNGGLPPY